MTNHLDDAVNQTHTHAQRQADKSANQSSAAATTTSHGAMTVSGSAGTATSSSSTSATTAPSILTSSSGTCVCVLAFSCRSCRLFVLIYVLPVPAQHSTSVRRRLLSNNVRSTFDLGVIGDILRSIRSQSEATRMASGSIFITATRRRSRRSSSNRRPCCTRDSHRIYCHVTNAPFVLRNDDVCPLPFC